jgi:hypothetical protein
VDRGCVYPYGISACLVPQDRSASILLLINTMYYGAYPSSFVNAVWAVIGVVAVAAVVRKNAKNIS